MMQNPIKLYSLVFSVTAHLALFYIFSASTMPALSNNVAVPPMQNMNVYYVDKMPALPAKPAAKENAPTEGLQVATPKDVTASSEHLRQEVVILPMISSSSGKPGQGVFVQSKKKQKRLPSVENLQLKTPEMKKIFFQYYDQIRMVIEKHTLYPYEAKVQRIQGEAYVSFVLKRSGRVSEILLMQSSGSGLLDDAAMGSIRNAEPFPAFPMQLHQEEVKLNVPISFQLN